MSWNCLIEKLIHCNPDSFEIADSTTPGMSEAMAALKLRQNGSRMLYAIEKDVRPVVGHSGAGTSRAAGNV